MSLFSIIIPAYKPFFLKECIDSILAQTYEDFELIIVNDASPYDIDSIINLYNDRRIHYYRNKRNIGAEHVVDNWNICLSYSTGEWIICMGDDDMLMPNCLEKYYQLINNYKHVDILHARVRQIDENGNLIKILNERPEIESAYSYIRMRLLYRLQYIGDFCFRRSRLIKEGGFFNQPYAWASDDITTFSCASPNGIANTNVPTFCYRINQHTITKNGNEEQKLQAIQRERIWLNNYIAQQQPTTELGIEELKYLKEAIPIGINTAIRFLVYSSVGSNKMKIFTWFLHRKKYHIPTKMIISAFLLIIRRKL